MRHADVVAFIKKGGDETWLLVVDPEADAHFKKRGVVPTGGHVTGTAGCCQNATGRVFTQVPRFVARLRRPVDIKRLRRRSHERQLLRPLHPQQPWEQHTGGCLNPPPPQKKPHNSSFILAVFQLADDEGSRMMDPFAEMGLSATAAEEKMKVHAKEKKKAPQMDWMKKYELFSNF